MTPCRQATCASSRAKALLCALRVLGASMPTKALAGHATPALMTSDDALDTSVQGRVNELPARAEVRGALAARGVDTAQVQARWRPSSMKKRMDAAATLDTANAAWQAVGTPLPR